MKKTALAIVILTGGVLVSCSNNNRTRQQDVRPAAQYTDPAPPATRTPIVRDEIVSSSVTDAQGNRMDLNFNNTLGTATVNFDGEVIEMTQDTTASGVRMHNDNYEYEEWQGHVVLKRDGNVVFDNVNNINTVGSNNRNNLNMTFNNNNGTATIRLNGQNIVLRADTTASGLRFSNNDYVYEEWKGHRVLKKNGEVIFDSRN